MDSGSLGMPQAWGRLQRGPETGTGDWIVATGHHPLPTTHYLHPILVLFSPILWNTDNKRVMPSSCLTDCPTFISSSRQPADFEWTYKRTIVRQFLRVQHDSVGPGTKGLTAL